MTDTPIIFSAPMVRALLDGRKSQTRRVLKPQPSVPHFAHFKDGRTEYTTGPGGKGKMIPYSPGDRLYVREAWCTSPAYDDIKPSEMGGDESIMYAADGTWESWGWGNLGCVEGRARPSIHMPRWASRLTLTVNDVRVQRLQEISAEDATAEGIPFEADALAPYEWSVSRFADLWNSIHGPEAWDANPWVAAISFIVHRGNIDAPMTPTPQDRR